MNIMHRLCTYFALLCVLCVGACNAGQPSQEYVDAKGRLGAAQEAHAANQTYETQAALDDAQTDVNTARANEIKRSASPWLALLTSVNPALGAAGLAGLNATLGLIYSSTRRKLFKKAIVKLIPATVQGVPFDLGSGLKDLLKASTFAHKEDVVTPAVVKT